MLKNFFMCIVTCIFIEFKVVFAFKNLEFYCCNLLYIVVNKKSYDEINKSCVVIEYVCNNFIKKFCISCVFICDVITEKLTDYFFESLVFEYEVKKEHKYFCLAYCYLTLI